MNVASQVLQLIGFEKNQSEQRINDIIQFEMELAAVSCKLNTFQSRSRHP